jgi:hypothetical protein
VLLAHRNFCKTTLALTIADENCRRRPGHRSAIVFKTKDHASKVIKPIMEFYLRGCPEALRPKAVRSDFLWAYPNGSSIDFFGGDHEHIETARGRGFHDVLFDEAGHQENLEENQKSIILPGIAKLGVGQLISISTPSTIPSHYFELACEEAKKNKTYSFVNVDNNPDLTPDWIAARAAECGGRGALQFLREYLCQFVLDPSTTVLPGVTQIRINGLDGLPALVQKVPMRLDREWYCAMDVGGKHLTGLLWGYYDDDTDSVYILREHTTRNASTLELASSIVAHQEALWGSNPPEYLHRWSDNNNLFLLHDLHREFKLSFRATRKDQKMGQIGALRRLIAEGKLIVDPSCSLLISTLKKAQWKKTGRTDSGFAEDPEIGHADLLDALLYLTRNVRRRSVPGETPTLMDHARMREVPQLTNLRTTGMKELAQAMQRDPSWTEWEQ